MAYSLHPSINDAENRRRGISARRPAYLCRGLIHARSGSGSAVVGLVIYSGLSRLDHYARLNSSIVALLRGRTEAYSVNP